MADVTSPYELIYLALKQVIETEFAAEGFTVIPDKLHPSLGLSRVDIGVSPVDEAPWARDAMTSETTVELQFFDIWKKEIDPNTQVNPIKIATYAERFKRALQRSRGFTDPGTDEVWYFDLRRVQFPDDPTGNKSRFVATIRSYGNNTSLVETTA